LGLYCGIDWATEHHDVAVVDDDGRVVARGRVDNDAGGFAQLLTLLAEAGDTAKYPIPVGIRNRPRAVGGGIAGDRPVIYPIIPLAASRCRARYAVSGAKSDATDAVLLANIIRTDPDAHRPLPPTPSWPGRSGWLARAQQDAVWARQKVGNQSVTCSKTSTRPPSWRSLGCPAAGWPAPMRAPSSRPRPPPPRPPG
jgi:hypothetical protein